MTERMSLFRLPLMDHLVEEGFLRLIPPITQHVATANRDFKLPMVRVDGQMAEPSSHTS